MNQTPLILIHGAWHAAWCFEKIVPMLRSSGKTVFAPDLPGHGSLMKPAKEINLTSYVDRIVELVKEQDRQVVLAGHSMGGIIMTQVAELIPEQIAKLIYISAYIPQDGESLISMARGHMLKDLNQHMVFDKSKSEIRLDKEDETAEFFYHLCNDDVTQNAVVRWQPQPFQPFADTVSLSGKAESIPKYAIIPRHDRAIHPTDQTNMSQAVTDDIFYIDADHSPFYSATEALAGYLK